MASFIIALLIGGLEIILILVVALNIANSAHPVERWDGRTPQDRVKEDALGGAMAITCLSCMSVPLCLVGVGLALVGLGRVDKSQVSLAV
jgi:hypothetical protein